MSKLLSILVAAVFAVSTGSVFAASHMKAAPAAEKKEEMKKDAGEMKKDAKEMKKEHKATKKMKKEKKEAMKKEK